MDNKFGKCCKCPAKVDSMRQFTEFESTNDIIYRDMKKLGFTSVYEYDEYLELNGTKLIAANVKWQKDNHTCQDNKQNKFNIDSSGYHKSFDEQIRGAKQESIVPVDSNVLKHVLSTGPRDNYNAQSINSDRPLFTMAKP